MWRSIGPPGASRGVSVVLQMPNTPTPLSDWFDPNTPAPPGLCVSPKTPAPPAPPPVGELDESLLPNTPKFPLLWLTPRRPVPFGLKPLTAASGPMPCTPTPALVLLEPNTPAA